jgi:hypothetical protein
MTDARPALRAAALVLTLVALAGCSGERFGGLEMPGSGGAPQSAAPAAPFGAPSINMAGRWLLSQPGRGQCYMNFGATAASAIDGTIAPEGGCPGKFFTSRRWLYEQGNLVMRDHQGQTLAQLSEAGGRFDGKAASGEPISLAR